MGQKPLVALMQPSSGLRAPHRGAVEAFLRPTRRGTDRVELRQGTSMLPRCFNFLWADVLNAFRSGAPITHVAMIHDDVAPDQRGGFCDWLDVLMDELDATGADLVSAVVPIKNGHGVTSTAVEVDPAKPWNPRRLTLREVYGLPETFGAEDVPWNVTKGCLLINTGLWVARFDPRWADPEDRKHKVVFRFVNDIIRTPDGVWAGTDLPEDWEFARDLARQGKRCVATRKVGLEHEIPLYHNRAPWGDWPTDVGWLTCSQAWAAAEARNKTDGEASQERRDAGCDGTDGRPAGKRRGPRKAAARR